MILLKVKIVTIVAVVLFCGKIKGQEKLITNGQFEYGIIETHLGQKDKELQVDTAKMINWLSEKYSVQVCFNDDFVAIIGKNGTIDTRMIFPQNGDSTYLFMEAFGEKSFQVMSNDDLRSQAAQMFSSGGLKVDTISKDIIGTNVDGLNITNVVLKIEGQQSSSEYATNINISIPFPVHRFPILSDKVVTRFEFVTGEEMVIFGMQNFSHAITDESVLSISTTGYKRRNN